MSRARRFDAANYLDTQEARALYLQLAFESGDPAEILAALGTLARVVGIAEVAKKAGVTRDLLYEALGSSGDLDLALLLRVVRALDLRLDVAAGA